MSHGRPVHGWVILDKPVGLGSTQAVGRIRRLFDAEKAGHAGTLDPLASGVLPVALGEATKTIPFIVAHDKRYRFTVRFGVATTTDDMEGEPIAEAAARPEDSAIAAALPGFVGRILQTPPAYSAIKLGGKRAYALARAGETPELAARRVDVMDLRLVDRPDPDHAVLEVDCGPGTYVRSIARDLGRALGVPAHVSALRRLSVGRFTVERAWTFDALNKSLEMPAGFGHSPAPLEALAPVETALDDIPALAVTEAEAARMKHGQTLRIAGDSSGPDSGKVCVTAAGKPVAIAEISSGEVRALRVFNL